MTQTTKGILFDMDGTLWDSSEQVTQAWNTVLSREPEASRIHLTTEQMQSLMGKTMTDIFASMLPSLSESRRTEIGKQCCEEETHYLSEHGGTLYPGVEETLRKLGRNYRLFIVSNCQDGYIEAFLKYYGFADLFADTECFGRTGKSKGENIRLLLERNHLAKAVYVGDTQLDFESSQFAGIPFLHAAYGFGEVSGCVPSVHTFRELPEAVSGIL